MTLSWFTTANVKLNNKAELIIIKAVELRISIRTEKGSVVERLFAIGLTQSISIARLRATADPRDNTIGAIESIDNHRIIGLQWHPEFLIGEEKGNLDYSIIFAGIIKKSKPFSLLFRKLR